MSGCELAEIEQAAGEKCQPIGHIGYYYPAEVWISEYGKLYAKYEYQDDIECFSDVFALIERDLRQCKFDSAAMKTIEALVYIDPPTMSKAACCTSTTTHMKTMSRYRERSWTLG